MLSRTISFVKQYPISTFIVIASTTLGYCAAPFLIINPFLLAGISAVSSLLFCSIVNCFKKKNPRPQDHIQPTVIYREHKREIKNDEPELSRKKNWVIRQIKQPGLDAKIQAILTREIDNHHDYNKLDKWIRDELVRGEVKQCGILNAIRREWIFRFDSTAFNAFKRYLLTEGKKREQKSEVKSTEQKSACLRLLDNDFKHISLHIEGFSVPFDEASFRNLMRESGESTITDSFFIILAREGRLSYLEHVFKQTEFKPNKKLLFKAIRSAAENNYLPIVNCLIKKLKEMGEEENEILPDIFTLTLKNGYLGMFRWLLLNYDDSELNNLSIEILMRIRASRATTIGGVPGPHDVFIAAYSEIRRVREEKIISQKRL
jgi:hypothetical protein